jgi:hypothetical protein
MRLTQSRSIVCEELLRCHNGNPAIGVACIYCDYKEGSGVQTPARLLSGLWRQLVMKSGKLAGGVQALYQRKRGQDLTIEEALRILTSSCSEFERLFVIVDALDECSYMFCSEQTEFATHRDTLLNALRKLYDSTNVNIMVTSRPEVSITYTFPSAKSLPIRATDDDIREYITSRITRASRFLPVLRTSVGLEDLIRSTVVEKAGGMYVVPLHEVLFRIFCSAVGMHLQFKLTIFSNVLLLTIMPLTKII